MTLRARLDRAVLVAYLLAPVPLAALSVALERLRAWGRR